MLSELVGYLPILGIWAVAFACLPFHFKIAGSNTLGTYLIHTVAILPWKDILCAGSDSSMDVADYPGYYRPACNPFYRSTGLVFSVEV